MCYFSSEISSFSLIFSTSSAVPTVQYGSHKSLLISHWSHCVSDVFALSQCCPDFLFPTALLLKNSLKPNGARGLRVSSVLLPSLDQMCASISCPRKMNLLLPEVFIIPGPDTKRPQRKTVPTITGFRFDLSWKWTTNIPRIVDWPNFFR